MAARRADRPEVVRMDATHADTLQAGAEQLQLQLRPRQADDLLRFLALLQRWNRTYNLTSVRDEAGMLTHHLLDCLAVLAPLHREQPAAARVLDVGSGGGLPGVVLALMRPDLDVHCVDPVGKKMAFVQQVAGELTLPNLSAWHARAEDLPPKPPFDVVVARAFSSLGQLVHVTRHLLAQGGRWMAMKGADPEQERAALPADIDVFHVEQLKVPGLDAQRCLVWMRRRPMP